MLCVAGPHPIPVTSYLRAGERPRRLREEPAVALLLMSAAWRSPRSAARVAAERL